MENRKTYLIDSQSLTLPEKDRFDEKKSGPTYSMDENSTYFIRTSRDCMLKFDKLGPGVIINYAGSGSLILKGDVDPSVVIRCFGDGVILFEKKPPQSVLDNMVYSGAAKITMDENRYFKVPTKNSDLAKILNEISFGAIILENNKLETGFFSPVSDTVINHLRMPSPDYVMGNTKCNLLINSDRSENLVTVYVNDELVCAASGYNPALIHDVVYCDGNPIYALKSRQTFPDNPSLQNLSLFAQRKMPVVEYSHDKPEVNEAIETALKRGDVECASLLGEKYPEAGVITQVVDRPDGDFKKMEEVMSGFQEYLTRSAFRKG